MYSLARRATLAISGFATVAVVATMPATAAPGSASVRAPAAPTRSAAAVSATWALPATPARMVIKTTGAKPIVSRDVYIPGTVTVNGVTRTMQIKGRGHSTWAWPTAKKPYKFKLDTAAPMLGMPKATAWVLLANFGDRSLLRNYLAYNLARRIGGIWQPRTRFVTLVLNGKNVGNYLFTEQVEQGTSRVSLPSGGMLLEVNQRFQKEGDLGYFTAHNTPISYSDPDAPTAAQQAQLKSAVTKFETALYGPNFKNPTTGYRSYINVRSFINWYLVNELLKNHDADFLSSDYFTWVPGGKFKMGPVWDFDLSAGYRAVVDRAMADPHGWWVRAGAKGVHPLHSTHWIARMFQDPYFVAAFKTRWTQLRPLITAMINKIPASGVALGKSATNDFAMWHTSGWQVAQAVHASTYTGEVKFLQQFLRTRANWISSNTVAFRNTARKVAESVGVVKLPVTIGGMAPMPSSVKYAVVGGTANPSDYTLKAGTLNFRNGATTKAVSVTIKNDTRTEPAETIRIQLSNPTAGMPLGANRTFTLTIRASD